jgi:DNA-binding transcriptional MerR regulator
MADQPGQLSVGQVAARAGLRVHTLPFYGRGFSPSRYTELVQAGDGNEAERLDLLRRHEQRIDAQRQHLDRCLDLIKFKIGVYEDILAATTGT